MNEAEFTIKASDREKVIIYEAAIPEVTIPASDYVRLKTLEENVNAKLAEYKECLNGRFAKDYERLIKLLESLRG